MRSALVSLLMLLTPSALAVEFDAGERAMIALHGPWPPPFEADSSNRVSGDPLAIRLGKTLFFDPALGGDAGLSCASCHDPSRAFTDGRDTGFGRARLRRNTSTVLNLAGNRWFGWDGGSDSLWAQSIRPLVAPEEMAITAADLQILLIANDYYRDTYQAVFGVSLMDEADDQVLVNIAKALAAYQETLITPRTPFDAFRDALLKNDPVGMSAYPESAQRGLKLFIGEGRCNLCHFGPKFSNGEFAEIGIPYFVEGGVDAGRYRGIKQVKSSPYSLLGAYNDGSPSHNAVSTRQVRLTQRNWGEFKVPGLRQITESAPYMHNGSLPTLRHVILHYSNLDEERLHADGEKILRPLNLGEQQIEDPLSFLASLSAE